MDNLTKPFISVLIATRNQAIFLPRCLESVLCQTVERMSYQVIVVNDSSTDETHEVLRRYKSEVTSVTHSEHRGLAAACNTGLSHTESEFIVRVDSDDWLDETALEQLMEVERANANIDIIIPDYWIIEQQGQRIAKPDIQNLFTWTAAGSLLRRKSVLSAGGYRDLFWEEYDLYLRMLAQGAKVTRLEYPVFFHQEHRDSMTAQRENRLEGWKQLRAVWSLTTLQKFGFREELAQC